MPEMPKLDPAVYPHGFCPFMSRTELIVSPPDPLTSKLLGPGAQAAGTISPSFVPTPCGGDRCSLWDGSAKKCCLRSLIDLVRVTL